MQTPQTLRNSLPRNAMSFPRNGIAQRRVIDGRAEKFCNGCKTWRALDEYHKNRTTSDGLQSHCKECQRAACKPHVAKQTWRRFDRQVARYVQEHWPRLKRKERSK